LSFASVSHMVHRFGAVELKTGVRRLFSIAVLIGIPCLDGRR
jgi:hypothetical protein